MVVGKDKVQAWYNNEQIHKNAYVHENINIIVSRINTPPYNKNTKSMQPMTS